MSNQLVIAPQFNEPTSPLPLPPGGRPAMGARAWLERIHLHHQARLPGWGMPMLAGATATWSLRAAAQALRQTKLDPYQTLQGWRDLPVLIGPGLARHWEVERPWMKWELYTQYTSNYQAVLDGSMPSDAYLPSTSNECGEIWRTYLQKTPLEQVCAMLDEAASLWSAWANYHPQPNIFVKGMSSIHELGAHLNLSPRQAHIWSKLELWWLGMAAFTPEFGRHLMDLFAPDAHKWFQVCAGAANATSDEIIRLFGQGGTLVKEGLYRPLSSGSAILALPGSGQSLLERMGSWSEGAWHKARLELVSTGNLGWNRLVSKVNLNSDTTLNATTNTNEAEPFCDWEHLEGGFEPVVCAIKAKPTLRILVVGDPGTGKTKLWQDLLVAAGKPAIKLNPFSGSNNTLNIDDNLSSLTCASWAGVSHGGAALIIDGHEGLFETEGAARFLQKKRPHPVIVVVENLKRLHASARESFDKVIWLESMPLPQRLRLAGQHFEDEGLALRVARALRTPRAILEAANWCRLSENWNWSTVQSHSRNAERAALNTGYVSSNSLFELEQPLSLADLPPMAGNAHLDELANRLALAFENPNAFSAMGAKPPKGAVLMGPPGTGKTLFTRHLAARLQAPLIAPDPSALAKHPDRVSLLFEFARRHAPCVVLLDEAEPLICLPMFGPPPEALAALLTEIDGVEQLEGVMVIATTNNSRIAPPLLRSGRLSEVRELDVPFQADREQMWNAYLKGRPVATHPSTESLPVILARASRGLTGADIADTLRRAAGEAVAAGETQLSLSRLLRACDDVRWGSANGRDSDCPEERRAVAIHEAGHALLAWRWGLDVQRITVRSRSGSLGMVQWDKLERRYEQSRSKAFGRLQMALGGIAAEQALLGEYGSGGSADLAYARDLLMRTLAQNGLGSLGPVSAGKADHWSDAMRRHIEGECQAWSHDAFTDAIAWLNTHQHLVNHLADCLLEAGDLSGHELLEHAQAVSEIEETLPSPPATPALLPLQSSLGVIGPTSSTDDVVEPVHSLHNKDQNTTK